MFLIYKYKKILEKTYDKQKTRKLILTGLNNKLIYNN